MSRATGRSPATPLITGTWITLFHQDSRNDYTNGDGNGSIAPDWQRVVADLADLGMRTLILMAVANEGVAAYPSPSMRFVGEPGATAVDVIMRAAEAHGMGVYLSSGWVRDQDDDVSLPETRHGQFAIMAELAALYGGSRAFEGWYLPCEDSVAPRFSEKTIAGVNALAVHGRALVPEARVLISPYYPHDAVVDGEFVRSLARLEVDAVAYQDGIGCAYTASLRDQLERLRWAHDQVPGIELWANVESFAWDGGVANVRDHALVPAAFPRLLRQLLDSRPADRVVSFIAQGLLQSPAEVGAIGHPSESSRLRREYDEYRAGRGRWDELIRWRDGALRNDAERAPVTCSVRPRPSWHGETRLTDGRPGRLDPLDPGWVRFEDDVALTVDLGRSAVVQRVGIGFLHSPPFGIGQPGRIRIAVSEDGLAYRLAADVTLEPWSSDALDTWTDLVLADVVARGRFVRVHLARSARLLLVDQVFVRLGSVESDPMHDKLGA